MAESSERQKPKFQYSLRSLLLVTAWVAIIFSPYRAAGPDAFLASVICSSLMGIVFIILTRRGLGWYSLAVFAGVMIGGAIAVEMAAHTDYGVGWLRSRARRIDIDPSDGFRFFGWAAVGGAFIGGIASTFTAEAVRWRRLHKNRKPIDDNQSPSSKKSDP